MEGQSLHLRWFKPLGRCMWQIWKASSGIFQYLRHQTISSQSESIGLFFGQSQRNVSSGHGTKSVALLWVVANASEAFQKPCRMYGAGVRSFFQHLSLSKASLYVKMVGNQSAHFWPEPINYWSLLGMTDGVLLRWKGQPLLLRCFNPLTDSWGSHENLTLAPLNI